MALQIEPRLAPPCRWWLGWGVLLTAIYLGWLPGTAWAQTASPAPFEQRPVWTPTAGNTAASLAWGDVNGDGDLDLAVGYADQPIRVYLNQAGHLQTETDQPWHSADANNVVALAWGDMDNDGDLDLVVGNGGPDKIYRNDNGRLAPSPAWTATDNDDTTSIALGDMDGDGDLDLVVGNAGLDKIYLFSQDAQGQLAATVGWQAAISRATTTLAVGDADQDGDLDLAVGSGCPSSICITPTPGLQIYQLQRNGQGQLATQQQTTLTSDEILSLAWADVDADGDLDLAAGVDAFGLRLYLNQTLNQQLAFSNTWASDGAITTGVAWGDVDNNGHLDLVALNSVDDAFSTAQSKVYLNQPNVSAGEQWKFPTTGLPVGPPSTRQTSPELGDLDGDRDLDLAFISAGKAVVFPNRGGRLQPIAPLYSIAPAHPSLSAVAWGDVDGDGDLDLATVGPAYGDPTIRARLYFNDGAQVSPLPGWHDISEMLNPRSVAWGDVDGDGDLDLAIGFEPGVDNTAGQDVVYLNINGQLATTPAWVSAKSDAASSVAWGDLDADGDLDLLVSNSSEFYAAGPVGQNKIYLNQQGQLATTPAWVSSDDDHQTSAALGDVDGDGDLDLAVGNQRTPNKLYRNLGLDATGQLHLVEDWQAADAEETHSVAWGDVDGDGDLDLAVGNLGGPETLYLNVGGRLQPTPAWRSADLDDTWAIAWGDADGDGDLDLAAANGLESLRIYPNQAGILQTGLERMWQFTTGFCLPSSLAWGDLDGDGDLDLALGNGNSCGPFYFVNPTFTPLRQPAARPEAIVVEPLSVPAPSFSGGLVNLLAPANFYATAAIRSAGVIPITYTLFAPTGAPMQQVRAFYSPDGGGRWLPAVATSDTITQNLATGQYPTQTLTNTHVFQWDVIGSGFLGQSDNLVVRIVAIPALKSLPNGVAGPYQRGQVATQTYPFRVRGSQLRVMKDGNAAPNALVYRQPQGQTTNAAPIADQSGAPYGTDSQGYLQGRSQLNIGDRLVALAPITATESYSLYAMSAAPTITGLNFATVVTTSGVQTLTVASTHPLLLLNLKVALEWDARQDPAFLNQLTFDLRRTSEILFDATDGQAALGKITLVGNKTDWDRADIRIYASNALIPNADPGGIVRQDTNETIANNPFIGATTPYTITYQPGHVRIGALWNRFGEATGTLGEDWPRTLAHELGHYAFYLYDNYLGLQNGVITKVTSCTNTLMTDQYREDYSEFRTVKNWAADCAQTISAQRSGRADWQTITHFYPWLTMPTDDPIPGPATLPLAVTQFDNHFVTTTTLPLDVNVFDLVDGNGKTLLSSPHAQAVLYTSDQRLIDLGHPVADKLQARGAHEGDRLCVYDLPKERLGCATLNSDKLSLTLQEAPNWSPEIKVSPVNSVTVNVFVTNVVANLDLRGILYPENGASTAIAHFDAAGNTYSTTFRLTSGSLAGHIRIWVAAGDSPATPLRESLTSYALGGSPTTRIRYPLAASLGAEEQTAGKQVTPAIAPDGQVLIYGNVSFAAGEFYALQKITGLPAEPPPWTTVVGDGYRVLKSDGAPNLVNTSILFRYRGQDVPAGEERFLSLYFWNESAQRWERLPTALNQAVNEASAKAVGAGLYVLMSSLEIPLYQTGWNLLAYPVQQTRPVSEALASITGSYSLVYGYVITDTIDPWKLYAPDAPAYVNDLKNLRFGQGYWINASHPMTWLIKGPDQAALQAANMHSLPTPPATFYGAVLPGHGLTPAAGQPVQALINGEVCGQSKTQLFAGQIVYSLNVVGDGTSNPACSGAGQQVVITVAGLPLEETRWQNDRAQQVVINGPKLYLSSIRHNQPTLRH